MTAEGNKHQDHEEHHPQSPGEGNLSGGSWEKGKPPALANQRAGVASSQSITAVPHCPPCPMEVTSAGAKLAEQSRVLGCWLLPFPAHHLEQSHLQLVLPWREQGAGPSTAQLQPYVVVLDSRTVAPVPIDCRAARWGWWCLQGDKGFPGRCGQMCYSMGRVNWWTGDFRVPICDPKYSIPDRLKGLETAQLWHLCREEHLI